MATLKFVLRTNKRKADGTIPVFLRITENRKSRFVSTGITIEERHWNPDKEEVRRSHPQYAVFNDDLTRLKHEAQTATIEIKGSRKRKLSAEAVKKELQGRGASQFLPFAEAYAEEWLAKGKYWEWRKIHVVINKLKSFVGGDDLAFSDIDNAFLVRFSRYMRERLKNRTNTVAKNLQILHRIIKRAVQDGLVAPGDDPFLYFSVKTEPTTKEKLSIEEVRALEALDLPLGSELELARDAFLFSFYCAGIRFGDVCRLKWKNVAGGRLTYRMAKTQRPKSVKLQPQAEAILSKYGPGERDPEGLVFPILDRDYDDEVLVRRRISSKNVMVNRHLKTLAKLIKTNVNLSFHVSRHSFADYARTSGMDLYSISKALGHSNLKMTEVYLNSFDHEAVDNAMDRLFGASSE